MFNEQLKIAVKRYPNLKIFQDKDGLSFLRGILDIPNDNNEMVGHFLVEVRCSEKFPFRFPILFETGGDIPKGTDWHKYNNGSCCITVLANEILICRNGIDVGFFIVQYAIPYFANYIHRKQTGEYKNGEYAHGIKGVIQFYESLMKTADRASWIRYFNNTFQGLSVDCKRNEPCFCGSREKYKHCHQKVFNDLRQIGEEQVRYDFNIILNEK